MSKFLVKDRRGPLAVETDVEVARRIASQTEGGELWYVDGSKVRLYETAVELRRTILDPLREKL